MKPFKPDLVYFEPATLDYPLGQELYERYKQTDIPIQMTSSHNRITRGHFKSPILALSRSITNSGSLNFRQNSASDRPSICNLRLKIMVLK